MRASAQRARLERVDEDDATLVVAGQRIRCFVAVCPRAIAAGDELRVALTAMALDGLELRAAEGAAPRLEPLGGYRYRCTGRLAGGVVDVGGVLLEEESLAEQTAFEGEMVTFEVDRIDADFAPDDDVAGPPG